MGFVGYVVTSNGVSMEEDCVSTIHDWPKLQTHREVQVFLGFTNFYQRFVHQYLDLTRPLSNLLMGGKQGKFTGPFSFLDEARSTFVELKEKFSSTPMLRHFDPEKAVRLETSASAFVIAGILSQQGAGEPGVDWCRSTSTIEGDTATHWHPIMFWSRTMVPAERNYRTKDQEMLAIVMSLWHWCHYTKGVMHPVRVLTDHNNLTDFLTKKTLSGCDAHWWETLSAYHLKILHRPGRLNPADAPSRQPDYEQAKWSNQPPSAGCKCSPDGSSWVLSANGLGTPCDLSTCLLGALGLAGTGDREHLIPCSGCMGGDMSEMAYADTSNDFRDILRRLQLGD